MATDQEYSFGVLQGMIETQHVHSAAESPLLPPRTGGC
jgi:hypothetical protein